MGEILAKRKGVVRRGLKEAWSKSASRCTRTGSEAYGVGRGGQSGRLGLRSRIAHIGRVEAPLAAELHRGDEAGKNVHRDADRGGRERRGCESGRKHLAGPDRERRQRRVVARAGKERLPHQQCNQTRDAQKQT